MSPAHRKPARAIKQFVEGRALPWRVRSIFPDGRRSDRYFGSEAAADALVAQLEARFARLGEVTVEKALQEYRGHLTKKGNRSGSVETTMTRLDGFFAPVLKQRVATLNKDRGAELLTRLQTETSERTGKPLSVDTVRGTLSQARTFAAWWVKREWVEASPLAHLMAEGKRNHGGKGKTKLRRKEQRKLYEHAVEQAAAGNERAVGALVALLLGMRASEIVTRQVRDLDTEEWTLSVDPEHAKTATSDRLMGVPEPLREPLVALCEGKAETDYIFGARGRRHWRDWVRRSVAQLCRAAGVPRETAHGLRGAHSDLARDAGATGALVAQQLGHTSEAVTEKSYTGRRTVREAQQRKALKVLAGGKGQ